MEWTTIGGMAARHMLTVAAGALATHGLIGADPSASEAFVSAGMLFVGIGWSAWQKWGRVLVDERLAKQKGLHPDAIKAP